MACDGLRAARGARRDSRRGAGALRAVPRRVLARARARPVPGGVRPGADGERLARRAHPGGVRRRRPLAHGGQRDPRGDQRVRLQLGRLPRADVHDGDDPAARLRRAEAALPPEDRLGRAAAPGVRRHRADGRLGHDAASRRPPRGRTAATSCTGRRSGRRGRSTPTSCCCWRGRHRSSRWRRRRRASRRSSST